MALNFRNRIAGCTITNSDVGTVDVFPYLNVVAWGRSGPRDKQPLVWQGQFSFVQSDGNQSRIQLDDRKNNLWKRGGIVRITVQKQDGSFRQVVPLTISKYDVILEGVKDDRSDVQEIAIEAVCYLGEMQGKGRSEVVTFSATSPQTLATRVLEIGAGDRTLNIDLTGFGTYILPGAYTLNENQSAAGMAAELGFPTRYWIWVNNFGDIKASRYPLSNQDLKTPIQRIPMVDTDRYRRLTPNRDIPSKGIASGNGKEIGRSPYPRQSSEYVNRPANELFPDPAIGSQTVQALAKETIIFADGRRETKLTKPLASWGNLGRSDELTTGDKVKALTQYTVTTRDGLKQYNSAGNLVVEESIKQGIAGAFRTNYQDTIANVGDGYLTPVTLKTRREITYIDGLPLFQKTEIQYLADEDINGVVTESEARTVVLNDTIEENWTEFEPGTNLYIRDYKQVKRGASGEDLPAGPPQIERRPGVGFFRDRLYVSEYEPGTAIKEGATRPVTTSYNYGSGTVQASEIAQMIYERAVSEARAIQISIPLPDWVLELEDAFPRVDVGEYSYILNRVAISADENGGLYCTLVLLEIGTLPNPVPSRPCKQTNWPPSEPKTSGSLPPVDLDCTPEISPSTPFPTDVQINSIVPIVETVGVPIDTVFLSAYSGTPPYTFSAPGGLPASLSIVGNTIVGTGDAELTATNFTIRVTDDLGSTADTTVTVTFTAIEYPAFPVPFVAALRVGMRSGATARLIDNNIVTTPLDAQAGSVSGVTAVLGDTDLVAQVGSVQGVRARLSQSARTGSVSGAQATLGTITLSVGSVSGVTATLDGELNPFEIEFNIPNGYPEFEL